MLHKSSTNTQTLFSAAPVCGQTPRTHSTITRKYSWGHLLSNCLASWGVEFGGLRATIIVFLSRDWRSGGVMRSVFGASIQGRARQRALGRRLFYLRRCRRPLGSNVRDHFAKISEHYLCTELCKGGPLQRYRVDRPQACPLLPCPPEGQRGRGDATFDDAAGGTQSCASWEVAAWRGTMRFGMRWRRGYRRSGSPQRWSSTCRVGTRMGRMRSWMSPSMARGGLDG